MKTTRGTLPSGRGHGRRLFLGLTLVAGLGLTGVTTVGAVHIPANDQFELGPSADLPHTSTTATNIVGDEDVANGPDWSDLFNADGMLKESDDPPDATPDAVEVFGGDAATFIADDLSVSGAVDETVFAGSNKNNDLVASWNWDTGNAPVKNDLSNVYAYATRNDDDDLILYAGLERLSPNGDSHVDFEFNQEQIKLDDAAPCDADGFPPPPGPNDGSPCEFAGEKTGGPGSSDPSDFIVSLDYTKGGSLGSLEVRRWDGSTYVPKVKLTGEGCNAEFNGVGADAVCGFTNSTAIDGGAWPNFDSHAATIDDLPTNAFAEFGVNVTELFGSTPCFATFSAHTRSSASFTAELKDFAIGSFQVCQPNTSLKASATVTYTFYEKNEGSAPLTRPTLFDFVNGSGTPNPCNPLGQVTEVVDSQTRNVGDTSSANGAQPGNGVFDPQETWRFTCTHTVGAGTELDPGATTADSVTIGTGHGLFNGSDTTFCIPPVSDKAPYEDEPDATVNCDQEEQRTITVTIR